MQSIYLLTSLTNFKSLIKKTDTTNDNVINSMITSATHEIENYTKRKLRGRTYGENGLSAEYHNGNNKSRVFLDQYPIISIDSLYDDTERDFDSTTLKSSDEYIIYKDEGIIELYDDAENGSLFQQGTGNIKVIYTAGYDEFQIIEDTNDRIDFIESDGGDTVTANLTSGIYTASELASHVGTQMTSVGDNTYTVTYNYLTSKFTIITDGAFLTLEWTGTNSYRSACLLLGFQIEADDTGAITYTSDDSILGIPSDLERACLEVALRIYQQSKYGSGRFDKESEVMSGEQGGTLKFNTDPIPPHVKEILINYTRVSLL